MRNQYSDNEIEVVLNELGVGNVSHKGQSLRSCCPIHMGSGRSNFSGYRDDFGFALFSCFSAGCCIASPMEWVAAKARDCSVREATSWIAGILERSDLVVPTTTKGELLAVKPRADVQLGDLEALTRLQGLYPFHPYWEGRGYTSEIVQEFGLAYRSLDHRAVVPVHDAFNRFVGMMTRATEDDGTPKYLWDSPNEKGDFLFGIPQALGRPMVVQGLRTCFLVEGTLDVIKGSICEFPVIASQTNRLSNHQVNEMMGLWDSVIVVPDSDEAGEQLVNSAIKLLSPFVELAVVELPNAKDLDSLEIEEVNAFLLNTISSWEPKCHTPRRKQFTLL